MRLTTARYYTPSGRSIQAKGITPDIKVEPAKIEKIEQQSRREADLRGALENSDVTSPPATEPQVITQTPAAPPIGPGTNKPQEGEAYQLPRPIGTAPCQARGRQTG